jgi:putative membrane protein
MRKMILSLTGLLVVAACSKSADSRADSAAGGVGDTSAAATPAPAPAPAPLTDQNIVAKIGAADSAEIALAKVAESKATNAGVKSYARMLVTDHSAHAKELAALEKKTSLTRQPPPNDMSGQEERQALDRFTSLEKGTTFDTAFVNHEIEDHQKVISEVQSLEQQAQQPELKALLTKTLPTLQKHLDRAQALQKQLSGTK